MSLLILLLVVGIHIVHSGEILIGLFAPEDDDGGEQLKYAMISAISDINSNSFLSNYSISYLFNNSGCDAQIAMNASVWQLTNYPNITAIIGADCTVETQSIALLSGVYSVPTISYASTFIGLSDANGQKTYPTFMRVVPSDYFQAMAWLALADNYDWKRACFLTTTEPVHLLLKDTFLSFLSPDFEYFVQSFPSGSNMTYQLQILQDCGCTIFYLASYFNDAATVLFNAYSLGMIGPTYVWIGSDSWIQGDFLSSIQDTHIRDVVQIAVRGAVGFTPTAGRGIENSIFTERLEKERNVTDLDSYTYYAYDAVWTLGHALHNMIMSGFHPRPTTNFKVNLLEFLKNTSFIGVTGNISFLPNGDRIGSYDFRNFLSDGNLVTVGLFDPMNDSLELFTEVLWYNGTEVPKDRPDNCFEVPFFRRCEQICEDTATGPVCECWPGWKINSDAITCDVYPCILTPWSNWEICTQLCHYPKRTRTRSVNVTASNGSPICLYEILSEDMGLYDDIDDSTSALLVLLDEWKDWLPLQLESIYGLNETSLSLVGNALEIQVLSNTSCDIASYNLSTPLTEWAALCVPLINQQRYTFSYNNCSLFMEITEENKVPDSYIVSAVASSVTVTFILIAVIVVLVMWYKHRKLDLSCLPDEIRKPLDHAQVNAIKYDRISNDLYIRELNKDNDGFKFVINLFEKHLVGKGIAIERIIFGFNKILLAAFISKMKIMTTRVNTASVIFYKDTWKNRDPNKRRDYIYRNFIAFIEEFKWNENSDVPIIPMIHGTDEGSSLKIFESGFAALAQVDKGYYGKGIYFTTNAKYALTYCGYKDKPTLIVAYIIPGHVYPTIEHPNSENSLVGMPITAGYQTHYTLTDLEGMPASEDDNGPLFTEMVVDQESQILPSYLLFPNPVSVQKVLSKLNYQKEQWKDRQNITNPVSDNIVV